MWVTLIFCLFPAVPFLLSSLWQTDYSSLNILEEKDLEVLWNTLDEGKTGTISAQRMAQGKLLRVLFLLCLFIFLSFLSLSLQALTDLRVPHSIDPTSTTRYTLAQFKQLAAPALRR